MTVGRGHRLWPVSLACLLIVGLAVGGYAVLRSRQGSRVTFTAAQADALSSDLTSADPLRRQAVVAPGVADQLGTTELLPAGTTMTIAADTFTPTGSFSGQVDSVTDGAEVGRWRLTLVLVAGTWRVADTEARS